MRHSLLLILLSSGLLHAQQHLPGLDNSFGNNGWTTLELKKGNFSSETGLDVFVQHDKKYIAVIEVNEHTVLARYYPNGILDKSYGKGGYSEAVNVLGVHAVQQSDGKVVVAGQGLDAVNRRYAFGLARFNADGKLDRSFGDKGIVVTGFGLSSKAFAIALQADGKIVAGGFMTPDGVDGNFALVRYNRNGSLDLNFGTGGKISADIGESDNVNSIAIQQDGKIIAAGSTSDTNFNYNFAIARYTSNGSPDNSFGSQGVVITDFSGRADQLASVAIQNDGKIVAAGSASDSNALTNFALARYSQNGSLDNSFDADGKLFTEFDASGSASSILSVKLQTDGRIIASGYAGNDFALARYLADGSLDDSFDNDGKLTTDFGGQDFALSVDRRENGKIIAIGQAFFGAPGSDFAIARYNADGSLDNGFATDGKLTGYYPGQPNSQFRALALQKNGKLLAAGELLNPLTANHDFVVAQFDCDGTKDFNFGYGGITITDLGHEDFPSSIAIQKDGKVLVGGASIAPGGHSRLALVRYLPNGKPDHTFGNNGSIIDSVSGNFAISSILVQNNGRIIVSVGGEGDFTLFAYKANGTPDPGFGNGGRVTTDFGPNSVIKSLALQQDGKIVAAGYTYFGDGADFALARYTSNGSVDNSFGNGGKITTDVRVYDEASSLVIQEDGKIIVAGYTYNGQEYNFDHLVIRYDRNGNIDNSFGDNGHAISDFTEVDFPYSISLQKDGKILLTGSAGGSQDNADIVVIRFKHDGQLDKTFGDDGKLITDIGASNHAYASIWANDRFYVAGSSLLATGWTPIIVAYKARAANHDHPWYDNMNNVATGLSNQEKERTSDLAQTLNVSVLPNPSVLSFRLQLQSSDIGTVTINVVDEAGRLVETRSGVPVNSTIELGQRYSPGVYYAHVLQGKKQMTIKLLKTSK